MRGLVMASSFPFWLTLSLKLVVTIDIQVNASEKSVSPGLLFTASRLYTQIFLSLVLELIVSSLILINYFSNKVSHLELCSVALSDLYFHWLLSVVFEVLFSCVIAAVVLFLQAVSGEVQNHFRLPDF